MAITYTIKENSNRKKIKIKIPYRLCEPRRSKRIKVTSSLSGTSGSKKTSPALPTTDTTSDKYECFVCSASLQCSENDFIEHVDRCLESHESDEEKNEPTLIGQPQPSSTQSHIDVPTSVVKKSEENEDVDIDMIEEKFGRPQYTASDLQRFYPREVLPISNYIFSNSQATNEPTHSSEVASTAYSNVASDTLVTETFVELPSLVPDDVSSSETSLNYEQMDENTGSLTACHSTCETKTQTVESLKLEIQLLKANAKSSPDAAIGCMICYDSFQEPLVSTECWHVYCRDCWLRTLAVKKLCPKCKRITFPEELRRIYL